MHYKNSCPFQHVLQLVSKSTIDVIVFHDTMVKTTCNCINDYKVFCSYICHFDLQLMLIWMKMKMKNVFVSSIFNGIPK